MHPCGADALEQARKARVNQNKNVPVNKASVDRHNSSPGASQGMSRDKAATPTLIGSFFAEFDPLRMSKNLIYGHFNAFLSEKQEIFFVLYKDFEKIFTALCQKQSKSQAIAPFSMLFAVKIAVKRTVKNL